jgi:transposase-like protein
MPRKQSSELRERARVMYQTGRFSVREIGEAMDVSPGTVSKWVRGLQEVVSTSMLTEEEQANMAAARANKIAEARGGIKYDLTEADTVRGIQDLFREIQSKKDYMIEDGWTPEKCAEILTDTMMRTVMLSHKITTVLGEINIGHIDHRVLKIHADIVRSAKEMLFSGPSDGGRVMSAPSSDDSDSDSVALSYPI